jgi:hypothetical protein
MSDDRILWCGRPVHTGLIPRGGGYEDGRQCSETSAIKHHTPENNPKGYTRQTEHGESFKSRIVTHSVTVPHRPMLVITGLKTMLPRQ